MSYLNLGIVAHIDAGKTSLTERLLYDAGIVTEFGSVDAGTTQTDTLEIERRRGITIRAAVVSFEVGDVTVNLIDTPGHPDFIAEVERVLGVLDGAILVLSAVEGVQAQTQVLMRALQRLKLPTVLFVNKIDRWGADPAAVLAAISQRLTPAAVAMGTVRDTGTRQAAFVPYGDDDEFTARIVELAAERDERLLSAYLEGETGLAPRRVRDALSDEARRARVHPVFFGSAITGAGVPELTRSITGLLPTGGRDPDGPLSARAFKVERGAAGERIAYLRMFSGSLRVRDRIELHGSDEQEKVTGISVFERGSAVRSSITSAGQIAQVWGLEKVQVGSVLGAPPATASNFGHFAPPTLQTVIEPVRPADRGRLHATLTQLAEQDPLIGLRPGPGGDILVSLYGEVQKEVIAETLLNGFDLPVRFRETVTICIERLTGTGSDVASIGDEGNPFLATVGLRVEPGAPGSGISFELEVELGSMPSALMRAVEESVHTTLREGLYGWQVVDCVVTFVRSGYLARQSHAHGSFDKSMSSTAGDFRNLTPLVLMSALRQAGTAVYEPLQQFVLEVPEASIGEVLTVLSKLGAVPQSPVAGAGGYLVEGVLPAAQVHTLQQRLPALTSGEGILETSFGHYAPAQPPVPARPRSDPDPLDRRAYLQRLQQRS